MTIIIFSIMKLNEFRNVANIEKCNIHIYTKGLFFYFLPGLGFF